VAEMLVEPVKRDYTQQLNIMRDEVLSVREF
jgi:hypothetical protein